MLPPYSVHAEAQKRGYADIDGRFGKSSGVGQYSVDLLINDTPVQQTGGGTTRSMGSTESSVQPC